MSQDSVTKTDLEELGDKLDSKIDKAVDNITSVIKDFADEVGSQFK